MINTLQASPCRHPKNAARLLRSLPLLGLLFIATPLFAAEPPQQIQASYQILKSGLQIGKIEEVFSREKEHYTLVSTTSATGLLALFRSEKIIAKSSGALNDAGFQPQLFDYKRGLDSSKDIRAQFDWDKRQLTLFLAARAQDVLSLPAGTQDRLSAMYQFMFLPLQSANILDFYMSNGSKLDQYRYSIRRNQKVATPLGNLDAIYLDSLYKPGETRTQIWLASKYRNLPAKMIVTDGKGDQLTQILSNIVITP